MKTRAVMAFEIGKSCESIELDLERPQDGEVLAEGVTTGVRFDA